MRTGLIAANIRTEEHDLRAELPLAGRSVLAWQIDLLRSLGVERILCLCDAPTGEVLRLQHEVEGAGLAFHALKGFAALPALVRAEDDLVILRDGLVPDPAVVTSLVGSGGQIIRTVAAVPAEHTLVQAHPEDFERIDAARHWAGLLVMRGAPVQHLADFPADADPVSVLLRLALQAGTPCQLIDAAHLTEDRWLLAASTAAVVRHEQALIASVAPAGDWRAPFAALAGRVVRQFAPRGVVQGATIAGAAGIVLLLGGSVMAGLGMAGTGIAVAAAGSFAGAMAAAYATLAASLRRSATPSQGAKILALASDGLAALLMWFALSPWPQWQPLAIAGPLLIGLVRLAARSGPLALAATLSDRTGLLLLLALGASIGRLPEAIAALCAAVLAALLLRGDRI